MGYVFPYMLAKQNLTRGSHMGLFLKQTCVHKSKWIES